MTKNAPIELNIKGNKINYYNSDFDIVDNEVIHADTGENKATLYYLARSHGACMDAENILKESSTSGKLFYDIYEKDSETNMEDGAKVLLASPVFDFLPEKDKKLWLSLVYSKKVKGEDAVNFIRNDNIIISMISTGSRFSVFIDGEEQDHQENVSKFLENLKRVIVSGSHIEIRFGSFGRELPGILRLELQKNNAPVFKVSCQEYEELRYYLIGNEDPDYYNRKDVGFMVAPAEVIEDVKNGQKTKEEAEDICQMILERYSNALNGEIFDIISEDIELPKEITALNRDFRHSFNKIKYGEVVIGLYEALERLSLECFNKIVFCQGDPAESQYAGVSERSKAISLDDKDTAKDKAISFYKERSKERLSPPSKDSFTW